MINIKIKTDQTEILSERILETMTASIRSSNVEHLRRRPEELTIETELEEESGRWIAEVIELPGVLVYGQNEKEAVTKAKVLALQLLADRLEHGEFAPGVEKLFCRKSMVGNISL